MVFVNILDMGEYGDIYDQDGITKIRTWNDEIRRLAGNTSQERLPDTVLDALRMAASARVERKTHREDVTFSPADVDLYNLMSNATNLYAAYQVMIPMNDKESNRKDCLVAFDITVKDILEFESPSDPVVEESDPSVSSSYSTSTSSGGLGQDNGEGIFTVTVFGGGVGFVRKSGLGL